MTSSPVRSVLDQVIQSRKTHPKCRLHLLEPSKTKRQRGRRLCCLLALTLAGKFLCPVAEAFLCCSWNQHFFGISMQTGNQQLSRNLPGLQHQTRTAETSVLGTEQLQDSQPNIRLPLLDLPAIILQANLMNILKYIF